MELGRLALYHALTKQPGPEMSLIGMNNRKILQINLNVVCEGISEQEKALIKELDER